MAVETVWYDEDKTIVHHIFIGRWTLRELRESIDTFEATHIIDDDIPLYYISDMRNAAMVPKGVLAQREDFDDVLETNTITIIVGASYLIQVLVRSLKQIGIGTTMIFVDTLAEADAYIIQHKQTADGSYTG